MIVIPLLNTKRPCLQSFVRLGHYDIHVFFYKHIKYWIQTGLYLTMYDFEARIMLNFSRYQTTDMRKI